MKNHFFLLLCLFSVSTGFAQAVAIDTTSRPWNFDYIVNQFEHYPDSQEDIIFLGNSITSSVNWHELLSLPQARNRGISGDTSFGILERLDEVTEVNPAKVFLLIGINDLAKNFPAPMIIRNYEKIVQRIKSESPQTDIYVQTLMPVNNTFTQFKGHYNKDEVIAEVNEGIRRIAKEQEVNLIDLHPHFLDAEQRLIKEYTEDGLHLNAEGYAAWAEILMPYLK